MQGIPMTHRKLRRTLIAAAILQTMAAAAGAATFGWTAGYYSSSSLPNPILSGDVLDVTAGGIKYLDLNLLNQGSVNQSDGVALFGYINAGNSGTWDLLGDFGLSNGGYTNSFANTGLLRKSGGSGSSVISGIGFANSGVIEVQTGTIDFNSGSATFNAGSQFIGAGSAVISNNAAFNGAFVSQSLQLRSGTFSGGSAVMNGSVLWTAGTLNGSWSVAAGSTLDVAPGADKYMGAALTNAGHIRATDDLKLYAYSTLTNDGLYELQGDVNVVNGGYSNHFVNSGVFQKSGGTGTSAVGGGTAFYNSGIVDVKTGTIEFTGGDASFIAGTEFKGPGQVVISNDALFVGSIKTAGNLSLTHGNFYGGDGSAGSGATLNGDASWTGGTLLRTWTVQAGSTLEVAPGADKYMGAALTNAGHIRATDDLKLYAYNTLTNNGLYELQGDVNVVNGGYSNHFVNNGTFQKSSGTGTSAVAGGTAFYNNGVIEALSGTIEFKGGDVTFNDGTRFTGAGQVVVSNSAQFNGSFQTSGPLTLSGGTFNGTGAIIDGDARWTGGTMQGTWAVAAGRTLDLAPGADKYMSASLTNDGHIRATDDLKLYAYNTLTNNGLYELQGDVNVVNGGYSNHFVNVGTFQKSSGAGTSAVRGGTGFHNSGVIEALSGTIEFNGGDVTFDGGTRFKGAGQVVVSNSAQFNGSFQTSGHLTLSGGTFNGTGAIIDGDTRWTGGTMQGTWAVAKGRTLDVAPGADKYVSAALTNEGHIRATDDLKLYTYHTLTNNGEYEFKGDVSVRNGGYSNTFVNNGLVVKAEGTGTSSLSENAFVNNGTVDVKVGTIQLPQNFTNDGTLKGVGTFATNLLTNAGHVAPGESPGTLTISGNFAQTADGFLDIEVNIAGNNDLLLVNGSATLGGTLAVSCFAACSYAVGDEILILDYTGTRSGSFGPLTLAGFHTGGFETVYDDANTRVLLRVTETVTAVPEPSSWALMLGGIATLGWLARRRRG